MTALDDILTQRLKPCPFCGGKAEVFRGQHDFNDIIIRCSSCEAEGPLFDAETEDAERIKCRCSHHALERLAYPENRERGHVAANGDSAEGWYAGFDCKENGTPLIADQNRSLLLVGVIKYWNPEGPSKQGYHEDHIMGMDAAFPNHPRARIGARSDVVGHSWECANAHSDLAGPVSAGAARRALDTFVIWSIDTTSHGKGTNGLIKADFLYEQLTR